MKLRSGIGLGIIVLALMAASFLAGMFAAGKPEQWTMSVTYNEKNPPDLREKAARQIVFIPAMPEAGFNWPYLLAIPGSGNTDADRRRYLFIDTTNTGESSDVLELSEKATTEVSFKRQFSIGLADELGMPLLFPVFPRPGVSYSRGGEENHLYTHALDRDTMLLNLGMGDPGTAGNLAEAFRSAGFEAGSFLGLDLQLCAMIDHATALLNRHGHRLETGKVLMAGYSASGNFIDRFTLLHPDRVKAVAAGAALDDMALPAAELEGRCLVYPIGTGDYREITGREFDLEAFNRTARLVYMGENDTNDTLPYSDCYGDRERTIIAELWGTEVRTRARALVEAYGKVGGKGIFIFDKGIGHSYSPRMTEYIRAFFKANIESDEPVYPLPPDREQLGYTLYE